MVPSALPLFAGVPGGPELLVILLILVLLTVPVYVAWQIYRTVRTGPSRSELTDRVALLEHEVEELRRRVEELEGEDSRN